MLRKLCEYKGIEIHEAEACKDHIHMLVRLISLMQYIFADNSSLEMSLHPFLKPCL